MLLYLITDGKFHKIGITNRSIQARIKQLQTGNPYELKLIKVVNCGSEKHAQEMERFYHNKYYEYRMQGEWFDFKKLKPININDIIIMFNIFSDAFIYSQYKKINHEIKKITPKKITEKNKERYLKEKDELIKKKIQLLKYNIP